MDSRQTYFAAFHVFEFDIRLGDVVVSSPIGKTGGVTNYHFGKTIQNERFERMGLLNGPPVNAAVEELHGTT